MAAPVRQKVFSSKMPHDDWVRCFDVSNPKTHPKGYTIYKVTYKLYSRKTAELEDEIHVWKRYNDFKKLYRILYDWHWKLQRREEFPLFARAKVFGRFEEAVVEERRQCAFDLLAFAGCQYHLYSHKAFKAFFEGGTHVNPDEEINKVGAIDPVKAWSDQSRDSASIDTTVTMETAASDASDGSGLDTRPNEVRPDTRPNEADILGGVWQYRQSTDNISQESLGLDTNPDNDDDSTDFTDESALTTPLPDNDLTFFDPLRRASMDGPGHLEDNSWLLSAMSICAELESNSVTPSPVHRPQPIDSGPQGQDETETKNDNQNASSLCNVTIDISVNDAQNGIKSESESGAIKSGMKLSATMEEIANRARSGTGESVSNVDIGGTDDYIYQAAHQISQAQVCEANAQYSQAFDYYKTGVGILLTGVQDDGNKARREAVRKKTAQYLLKAEDLHNNFLRLGSQQSWAVSQDRQ